MIPWWVGLALFFAGIFAGVMLIALVSADRSEK